MEIGPVTFAQTGLRFLGKNYIFSLDPFFLLYLCPRQVSPVIDTLKFYTVSFSDDSAEILRTLLCSLLRVQYTLLLIFFLIAIPTSPPNSHTRTKAGNVLKKNY